MQEPTDPTERPGGAQAEHHLDADAVCAQCHTTNPEGTLICHSCGNNLRDQRHIRLQADEVLLGHGGTPKWRWALRGVIVAMVLVLPLVALNADEFMGWLVSDAEDGSAFWHGSDSATYARMRSDLDAAYPPGEELPVPPRGIDTGKMPDGFYVILGPQGAVGVANLRSDGALKRFVARLENGMEVRGRGTMQSNRIYAQHTDVGVKDGRRYTRAYGMGAASPAGGYAGYGQLEMPERTIQFGAYLLAPAQ